MAALPDFVIIGGQKCGTTAAARNLSLHPRIEVFRGVTKNGQKNEIEYFNQHWEKGAAWYASHFEAAEMVQGEKTAELLHRTVCHERMFETSPHLKLIVFLRSPVERAYSQWKMAALHKGDESDDFDTVVAREMLLLSDARYREEFYSCRDSGISCWREGYLLKGMYAEQLESLYKWFPKDHVFVAISERIRSSMAEGYSQIFEFLGLESCAAEFLEHFLGKPGPPMSPRARSLLSDLYKTPTERLFSLLGEEVPEWHWKEKSIPPDSSSVARLWSECAEGYLWPEEVRNALAGITDLSFDRAYMLELANSLPGDGPFVLTFLTKEYFSLGVLWAEFARKSGNNRFAIAAMDSETVDELNSRGIPAFEVKLPLYPSSMARHEIRNGFDSKALALIYCRTYLIKFLLDNGIDVVSCDIDALLTKRLDPDLTADQAIAFQRVAYFPKPIARAWGFTACAGFVAYRACTEVASLVSRVLAIQRELYDDQLALNLALLEMNAHWDADQIELKNKEDVIRNFSAHAALSIRGVLPGTQVSLTALPATAFWRHEFVPLDRNACVLLHPNSPKLLEEKLKVFSRILSPAELDMVSGEV